MLRRLGTILLAAGSAFGQNGAANRIDKEVRHELLVLPVFRIDGNNVTPSG